MSTVPYGPFTAPVKYPNALKKAARDEGRSMSEINRRALDHYPSTKKYLGGEVKAKPVKRFIKPTNVELYDYFTSQGLSIAEAGQEAQKFLDYYDSNYWKIGPNKMKDWKAAVRTWINRSKTNGNKKLSTSERVRLKCGMGGDGGQLRDGLHGTVRGDAEQDMGLVIEGTCTRTTTPGTE